GDIERYNESFEARVESWEAVGTLGERLTERRYQLSGSALEAEFYRFKAEQPTWFRIYESLDGKYVQGYLEAIHGKDVEVYNAKHGTRWKSMRDIVLPARVPADDLSRREWERFVREELNLQYIHIDPEAQPLFAAFLRKRYVIKDITPEHGLEMLNTRYGTAFASFDEVTFPPDVIRASDRLVDWAEFIKTVPAERLRVDSTETRWRTFLRSQYGDELDALNRAHESDWTSFDVVQMPTRDVDAADFLEHRKAVRSEFLTANYKQVVDYILLHGRSLWNTIIYCALAIALALTVNPLAAYALSRFKIPSTYKVLLFCMATMAFPAAVTMIPNFLLLKQLGLLNTYAALVLPGMANGFSIFLLKGFFDSLPRELYECAQLDGASEWTMFWQFTMALSKPILAVIALSAFTGAYGNFMFAFILCPDEKMWTLMVFLYQFQIDGHMALTFAALLIAGIPTFFVFVFCQNIIIRGIVVPVEK
ncbi:MAG TPA: carbohydrate ABC transporter permease, partial [Planctomycetota bacterium]|nr:carbohydrate ABC transporter permease [Planctomycetota bacterium]